MSKTIKKRIAGLLVWAVLLSFSTAGYAASEEKISGETVSSYETMLFDTGYVHEINVEISEADWTDLCRNPTMKTKYSVNVTIDGTTVENVSFCTKGNSSLSSLARGNTNRYSFKINFGKYVDDQTYFGLDKLNLNNAYSDPTYMKDSLSYEIFRAAGVAAPLTSFVQLSINGELLGLYEAIEDVDDSWQERNGVEGEIYKPDTDGFAGGSGEASAGRDLNYIGDDPADYSDIFENAISNIDEKDQEQLIAALKGLNENMGGDVSDYIDTEEVIRYFAAHNFVQNYDSYTGSMMHNYYLVEDGGVLSVYPWDYNEAFGAHGISNNSGEDSQMVNGGIDSPLKDVSESERPMWKWIVSNEEYLEEYHKVYDELISSFFESGKCEEYIRNNYELIRPYVETDPSAFFTVEKFDTAIENLIEFCSLRAQSIRLQLEGELAGVSSEQAEDKKVDTSAVSISAMAGGNSGGGGGGHGGRAR